MRQLCKVMPLVNGLMGFNAQEVEVRLTVGAPGWLDMPDALEAEARGDVVRMAGSTPQAVQEALRTSMMRADLEAAQKRPAVIGDVGKRDYKTRTVRAD